MDYVCLLKRLGYVYKQTKVVSGKGNVLEQKKFERKPPKAQKPNERQ